MQFHPEVTHTGSASVFCATSFATSAAASPVWQPSSAETIEAIKRRHPGVRWAGEEVLFFVSGGVDSTVAYKLCADALGQDRVHGVYVDTGFMRKNESAEVMAAYEKAGFQNVRLRDASADFLAAVGERRIPRSRRKRIGVAFLAVEDDVLEHLPRESGCWDRARSIRTPSSRAARASRR